jgi:hypothetical protein
MFKMNLINKINKFEAQPMQTVEVFNKLFTNCPIEGRDNTAEVEIGEILGPVHVRQLYVNGVAVPHSFESMGELSEETRENVTTNENLDNVVITPKELELDPVEYVVLQYLRGCQSPYHTQIEIASKVNKSVRGIRDVLKRMESKEIITMKPLTGLQRISISITENWL